MSIRSNILISIVVSVCVAVAGCAFLVFWQSRSAALEDFSTNAGGRLSLAAQYLRQMVNNSRGIVDVLAQLPVVTQADGRLTSYTHSTHAIKPRSADLHGQERAVFDAFASFVESYPQFELIYYGTEADGGFVQAPDDTLSAGFDPRKRPWYLAARDSRETVLTEFYQSDSGALVTTVAKAVRVDGRLAGVVGIDINLKEVSAFLDTIKLGKTARLFLTENTGLILYDPGNPERMLQNIRSIGQAGLAEVFAMGDGSSEIIYEGKACVAVSRVTAGGWHLIALVERAELLDNAMQAVWRMLVTGAGLAVLLALIGMLAARRITAPIRELGVAARKVADGDFEAIPRDGRFSGELKGLHADMLRMVDQLRTLIDTAQAKTVEAEAALEKGRQALAEAEEARRQGESARREGVKQTAEQLADVVGALDSTSHRLSEQTRAISQAVGSQLTRTTETADAMRQMNAAVGEVAQSASNASQVAERGPAAVAHRQGTGTGRGAEHQSGGLIHGKN